MGSGRDKRKKAKPSKPGAGVEKTERKTAKNAEKATRRAEKATQGGEDDIDALLASFKLQDQKQASAAVEADCGPPSARTHASFVPGPPGPRAANLYLYGGEYYDSNADKTHVYGDLYVYRSDKDKWDRWVIPKSPLPRSSHQAVVLKGYMYVFGGEFTSPNQEKFRHYSDTWRLDLQGRSWEQLPSRGSPSARSGHRMAAYKSKLLLFGGFYDTLDQQKYYNDLWEFDTETLKWQPVGRPDGLRPAPRGGCQLAVHGDVMFVVGGYSVKYDGPADREGTGVAHDDVWALDLATYTWERIKKVGMAPTPRASFGMTVHRNRAIVFGGVSDQEGKGDKLYSELHNELYQLNLDTRRWYPLALKAPKKAATAAAGGGPASASASATEAAGGEGGGGRAEDVGGGGGGGGKAGSGGGGGGGGGGGAEAGSGKAGGGLASAGEFSSMLSQHAADRSSPFFKAAQRIQASFRGFVVRKAYKTYKLGGKVSELLYSPATYGIDLSTRDAPKPRARANPMVAVVKNMMWVLGGIVEIAHTDVTLDDLWSLDLSKLDGWRCVKENSAGEEAFRDVPVSSDEEEEEEGEEEE